MMLVWVLMPCLFHSSRIFLLRRSSSLPCPLPASPSSPRELRWTRFSPQLERGLFTESRVCWSDPGWSGFFPWRFLHLTCSHSFSSLSSRLIKKQRKDEDKRFSHLLSPHRWQQPLLWFLAFFKSPALALSPSSASWASFKVTKLIASKF